MFFNSCFISHVFNRLPRRARKEDPAGAREPEQGVPAPGLEVLDVVGLVQDEDLPKRSACEEQNLVLFSPESSD